MISKIALSNLYAEIIQYLNDEIDIEEYKTMEIVEKYEIAIPQDLYIMICKFFTDNVKKLPTMENCEVVDDAAIEAAIEKIWDFKFLLSDYCNKELAPLIQA